MATDDCSFVVVRSSTVMHTSIGDVLALGPPARSCSLCQSLKIQNKMRTHNQRCKQEQLDSEIDERVESVKLQHRQLLCIAIIEVNSLCKYAIDLLSL